MAKNKISEFSSNPSNNTDIAGINIAEGCAPSGINNAIRELMAQLKDQQTGTDGDNFTVGGALSVGGNLDVTGNSTFAGTVSFTSVPTGVGAVPSGGIIMWSGSIASIPSGWFLCNGSNGTPDLRNRFIVGAHSDTSGQARTTITGSATQTGGSKDAIVVSHTHTATVTDPGHSHSFTLGQFNSPSSNFMPQSDDGPSVGTFTTQTNTTGISVSNSTTGSSGTNANLVPYYALAYIMRA